jgi:hypothetical protein
MAVAPVCYYRLGLNRFIRKNNSAFAFKTFAFFEGIAAARIDSELRHAHWFP